MIITRFIRFPRLFLSWESCKSFTLCTKYFLRFHRQIIVRGATGCDHQRDRSLKKNFTGDLQDILCYSGGFSFFFPNFAFTKLEYGAMIVIDLDNTNIKKACESLIIQFDYPFDLVVGIAKGGQFIAEIIAQKLNLPLLLVARQRGLTRHKNKTKNIYKYIPIKILNFIRIVENRCYEMLMKIRKKGEKLDEISIISDDLSFFKNPQIKNVLLVDDAIDSGATIRDTEKFLKTRNENWHIKIAVITQTFNQPLKKADYQIYNRVLVRFPWSNDFKQ